MRPCCTRPWAGFVAGRSKKGFIFSVIAISFMLLLMFLAVTMANEYLETERVVARPQPLGYGTAALDNIGKQFADILLPGAGIREGNETLRILIADSVPRNGISGSLNSMKSYAENEFASASHAMISANISQVNNNSIQAQLSDNFIYEGFNSTMMFRPKENNTPTEAMHYRINVSINSIRNTVHGFSFGGSGMNITLRCTDQNGTVETSGEVNPGSQNTFWITYGENESGKLEITVGKIQPGQNSYTGALLVETTNASADFSFDVELPLQNSTAQNRIVFPLELTYVQGPVVKTANASR